MDGTTFLMAGGGMAGLSLAYHMVTGPFPEARIIIVDREAKGDNDRTWCYWSRGASALDAIAYRSWSRLGFRSTRLTTDLSLEPYAYRMIRGVDFYNHVIAELERHPNVRFVRAQVQSLDPDSGVVQTTAGPFRGEWLFDSLFDPATYARRDDRYHYLMQHFNGWEVVSDEDSFDPELPILFDFRTPQKRQMRFFYSLPFSPRHALVEYTLFSASLLAEHEYAAALEEYLRDVLRISSYRVAGTERGVIPMTDEPAPRRTGLRAMTIGTKGGRVKPSTGYAFIRTQEDSIAIVRSLQETGTPFAVPVSPSRFRALDSMLLQIMYRRGEISERVFAGLFGRNPVTRLFRFLDEQASLTETVAVMASVPWAPFIGAWFRLRFTGRA